MCFIADLQPHSQTTEDLFKEKASDQVVKSKMIFLLCGLIFLLFLISIAELDARFHIIEFLGIPCESIYNEERCITRDEPWTKPLF